MSETRSRMTEQYALMAANGLVALLTLGTALQADPFRTLTNLRIAGGQTSTWITVEQQASMAWGVLVAWEPDQYAAYRLVANALDGLAGDYAPDLAEQCRALATAIRAEVGKVSMAGNPYAAVLDHNNDSSAIIRAQSGHSRTSPESVLNWAWWWYTTGELHAAAARYRGDGTGNGSVASCFGNAADRFEQAGDADRAALCRDLQASRLRLAARERGGDNG